MEEKKISTIRDVAYLAGVSVSTVSRYLNQSGYVSSDVTERITKAINDLNYVPSRFARALKDSRTKEIALIVPDITNPYYANVYTAAQEYSEKYDYTVLLYNTGKSASGEIKGLEVCRDMQVEGLFFCSEGNDSTVLETLEKLSIPVVLSYQQKPLRFDTVHSRGHGIYIAARHLCELGHKHIAYSGGPVDSYINENRKDGFVRAITEAGLAVQKDYIFEMDFTMDAGYKSGLFFNSLRIPPTAIVAANDIIAMGIIIAMTEVGKRIPDDISLTGEDNIEFTNVCRPALTTIDNDPQYLAAKACEFLFSRLLDGFDGEARIHDCPRKLIVRDSTAPPKIL